MPNMGLWDWAIIAGIVLVLFGAKKLPEFAKGLGKSITSFKQGLREVSDDMNKVESEAKSLPEDKKE